MNVLNFTAVIDADLTIEKADNARKVFVEHVTAMAGLVVPHLSGGKPRNGSAEQTIMADILAGYQERGLSKAAATQARTRLLNTFRIMSVNPRHTVETDAEYAIRVMEARTVANVGTKDALLAAIAGKGAQAKALAKAKRTEAAKNAADRKAADAAKADPKAAAAAAKVAKADADAAKVAADAAAKANPQAAAEARATLVEQNRIQSPKTMRGLVLAFEAGEIDDAAWAQTLKDWEYVLGLAKAARRPVVEGTTEAPKAKRTRKAKAA